MSRFRFRLATLLRVSEARRDAARREVQERSSRLRELEEREARILAETRLADRERDRLLAAGVPALDLRLADRHRETLTAPLDEIRKRRREAEDERRKALAALEAASRKARVLADLRDRARRRHQREMDRRDQKWVDELYALHRTPGSKENTR